MNDFSTIIAFGGKLLILLLIAFYLLLSTLVYLNVRGLNHFVLISYHRASHIILLLFLIHLLLVVSLFLLALVIL